MEQMSVILIRSLNISTARGYNYDKKSIEITPKKLKAFDWS